MSDTLIKVSGSGFDPSITSSYLHFDTTPFTTVDFDFSENIITITIVSKFDVDNCVFMTTFDPSGVHTLSVLKSPLTINELSDSGDYEGYLRFWVSEIPEGTTIIKIKVNFTTPLELFLQSIILFAVSGAMIGTYYYFKRNEVAREKAKKWINQKIVKKLERKEKEKGLKEVKMEIKDGKIYIKPEGK